jgi:hypothetical protein
MMMKILSQSAPFQINALAVLRMAEFYKGILECKNKQQTPNLATFNLIQVHDEKFVSCIKIRYCGKE